MKVPLSFVLLSSAGFIALGSEQKAPMPESWGVVITKIVDIDRIEAKGVTGDRKFNLALANIVPFSAWPKDLTDEEKELKKQGMRFLETHLLGKEGTEYTAITGFERNNVIHGDIVLRFTAGWKPGAPSSLGWGIFHFNCRLIEEGYVMYHKDRPDLFFKQAKLGALNKSRQAIYEEADAFAKKYKNGLWKHPRLIEKLKASFTASGTEK